MYCLCGLNTRKNAFFALFFFTLPSKVDLIWTRAIQPSIAQSVQFSKIAKEVNIVYANYFSIERKHCSY